MVVENPLFSFEESYEKEIKAGVNTAVTRMKERIGKQGEQALKLIFPLQSLAKLDIFLSALPEYGPLLFVTDKPETVYPFPPYLHCTTLRAVRNVSQGHNLTGAAFLFEETTRNLHRGTSPEDVHFSSRRLSPYLYLGVMRALNDYVVAASCEPDFQFKFSRKEFIVPFLLGATDLFVWAGTSIDGFSDNSRFHEALAIESVVDKNSYGCVQEFLNLLNLLKTQIEEKEPTSTGKNFLVAKSITEFLYWHTGLRGMWSNTLYSLLTEADPHPLITILRERLEDLGQVEKFFDEHVGKPDVILDDVPVLLDISRSLKDPLIPVVLTARSGKELLPCGGISLDNIAGVVIATNDIEIYKEAESYLKLWGLNPSIISRLPNDGKLTPDSAQCVDSYRWTYPELNLQKEFPKKESILKARRATWEDALKKGYLAPLFSWEIYPEVDLDLPGVFSTKELIGVFESIIKKRRRNGQITIEPDLTLNEPFYSQYEPSGSPDIANLSDLISLMVDFSVGFQEAQRVARRL